ncbi:hypothetical protein M569_16282, partial [Genlisea aurea]
LIFADRRLAAVYPAIQKFKSLVSSDPRNVTVSWVGADVCRYRGFYCDSPPDNSSAVAVASVDFNGFHLTAPTLAGFIDQLPDIAIFHANSNFFSGGVPVGIARLPYLYELDLSNNLLSGDFPAEILAMGGFSLLDIRFNFFTGAVPPAIFAGNLNFLFINNNDFITTLPEISVSAHLLFLTLANNRLFGPIPASIGVIFSGVSEILLQNNSLTGCLPYQLGLLKEVVVIDAAENQLTGPLPTSIACLEKVEILNLAGNRLYGSVPDLLCRLSKLTNLSLSDNYFTVAGDSCMGLIRSGVLDLTNNCIPGLPFQRPPMECAAFFAGQPSCPNQYIFSKIPCRIPF